MGSILEVCLQKNDQQALMKSQKQDQQKQNIQKDSKNQSESQEAFENAVSINIDNKPKQNVSLKDFEILKLLGTGSFGTVYLVQKKDTKKYYAMKRLNKENLVKKDQILKTIEERNIMSNLKCPFIIQLQFAFQTPKKLYFVMEFMQGGEMFLHIRQARQFSEQKAKFYVAELVLALEYMHSKDTIYRDLKPENILIDKDGHIKICDFGLSKQGIGDNETTKTVCGTPEYLAPEILKGRPHGKEVDWYSLPEKRLGRNGSKQIKNHTFFHDIDWEKLYNQQIPAPFIPKLKNEFDLSYISAEFKNQAIDETYYKKGIVAQQSGNTFQDFSYVNEGKSLVYK